MRLYELAYTCRIYSELTKFDASISKLRGLGLELDPRNADHRQSLFEWLNKWGCRQFSVAHHETVASQSLIAWSDSWLSALPPVSAGLEELEASELDTIADAYGALALMAAGYRDHKTGMLSEVRYGPVGASKVLLALRPNACPPWDRPIILAKRYGEDSGSYRRYLVEVVDELREVSKEGGIAVKELPVLIGRPDSSPPKLIDEHNWVTITRGMMPPAPQLIERWNAWARIMSRPPEPQK